MRKIMFALETVSNEITNEISNELKRLGILFGVFSRIKNHESIKEKLERPSYKAGKQIQDYIGIRVTLYFTDDLPIVINLLRKKYEIDNADIDRHDEDTFRPKRLNLVCRLGNEHRPIFSELTSRHFDCIDTAFEVQIRTVLSEGWHEVEHDLRYKCRDDWENHKDFSRALNGIYATLETSEWSMLNLFLELAYRNYKEQNWEAMLRNKFRLRFKKSYLNAKIKYHFDQDKKLAKKFYKIDRKKFLSKLTDSKLALPITFDNLILVLNHLFVKDEYIKKLESDFIRTELEAYL